MSRNNRPPRKKVTSEEVTEENIITDEKLQKVLARQGLGSRREMEKAIVDGRVSVNGAPAKLGDRVRAKDKIEFDGRTVNGTQVKPQSLRVILYNKPEGEICSRSDPEGRPTVFRNLPRLPSGRWISVGRLDYKTTGLLLFTNDGDLANKLMHPSSNIDREYLVRVQGLVEDEVLERLKEGVLLEDGPAKFTDIQQAESDSGNQWYYCVVMEGKNREVRRLWESQGLRVSRLKRVRYGNIFIPSYVRVGQWVELNDGEIAELCETAGVDVPPVPKYSEAAVNARERHRRRLRSPGAAKAKTTKAKAPKAKFDRKEKKQESRNSPWEKKGGKRPNTRRR